MSSLARTVSSTATVHRLPVDALAIDLSLVTQHGRSSRTVVKQGPLRLTLVELAPGGTLPEHTSEGPLSIHVLRGHATITADAQDYVLCSGDVLVLASGVKHSAFAELGVLFLLSLVHSEDSSSPAD